MNGRLVELVHRPAVAVVFFLSVLAAAPSASAWVTTAPLSPQNVTWRQTDDGMEVTWDAPLYDGGDPILYYRVYRDGQLVADEIQDEVYLDIDVLPSSSTESTSSVTYSYAVTAVNSVGESLEGGDGGVNGNCYDPLLGINPTNCQDKALEVVVWVLEQIL